MTPFLVLDYQYRAVIKASLVLDLIIVCH